jgi:tRNA(fMet)-specific endonuclease VapC
LAADALMLDTSAYSAFKRGHSEAVAALRQYPAILLPVVVLGELLAGFAGGTRRAANLEDFGAFLNSPRVRLVSLDPETAKRYAEIYNYLRSAGLPVPTNDIWIAASAMQHGAQLLTLDAHFLKLPQVLTRYLSPEA